MSRSTTTRMLVRVPTALTTVVVALALLGTAGCSLLGGGASPVEVPTGPAGITGEIKSIEFAEQGDGAGSMLVEGGEQPAGAVSDKAMVAFAEDTKVARAGRWIPPSDLEAGMKVRVWFEGPVAESYPVQGKASFIEVE
jgi:hypothetical protein